MSLPLTVIGVGETSEAKMAKAIAETHSAHGSLLQAYHQVWYGALHTWPYTHFLGVGLMKSPNDLWIYQDLLTKHRPKTIIETGTFQGGSALWFATIADALDLDCVIYTIDIEDRRRCTHPRVTFLAGDSTDPVLAGAVLQDIEYPLLVSLDADHSAAHVRKELDLYGPACQPGDWLVVEDTNIAWPGPAGDRGAAGGVADYLDAHAGEWRQDLLCERYLLTMNPGGWLQRIAPCPNSH